MTVPRSAAALVVLPAARLLHLPISGKLLRGRARTYRMVKFVPRRVGALLVAVISLTLAGHGAELTELSELEAAIAAQKELLRGAGDVHTDHQGIWQASAPPPPNEHEALSAAEDAYAFAQDALRRLPPDVTIEVYEAHKAGITRAREQLRAARVAARAADTAREKSLASARVEAVKQLAHLNLELERRRDVAAEKEAVRTLSAAPAPTRRPPLRLYGACSSRRRTTRPPMCSRTSRQSNPRAVVRRLTRPR